MRLFHKNKSEPELPQYDLAAYEPVIRASICTGEKVACMREKESGRLHELMMIRMEADLDRFCKSYGVERKKIRTVY